MIRFEDNLGIHLFKAYFSIYKYLKRTFSDHHIENMNPTRLGILLALADQDGVIMSKLGRRLFLEKSTMTGVIDKMEADGLVNRRTDKTDRRAVHIYLTEEAKKLNERVLKIIDEIYSDLSGDLSAQEVATSVKVSKQIGQAAYDLSVGNEKKP